MKCPRCQQDNPSHAKFCLDCGAAFKRTHESGPPVAPYADLQHALSEALEQQTATSEILRIISRSPTNLQPVLDAIATNAALVCHAYDAVVFLREGDRVRYAAHYGPIEITLQHATLSRGSVTEAAILDRQPVHVHDLLATEPPAFPLTAKAAREGGFRAVLSVPLLRENEAIGALAIRRREVQPFTDQQIELLKTFADQAVIAIENVRLFTELQEKNRAVTEALEQQTATSEILKVISSSPTDVQPVFHAIAASAARLCGAENASVWRLEDERLLLVASQGSDAQLVHLEVGRYSVAVDSTTVTGRCAVEARTVHVEDLRAAAAAAEFPAGHAAALRGGHRTTLSVPLMREGKVIGTIALRRGEVRLFTETQISLLQTFAEQAVIAIENGRLFTELQTSNRELTTALDTQTATSDILRVISRSQTDVQPVFDTIVESAVRLLRGYSSVLTRVVSDRIELAAFMGGGGTTDDDAVLRAWFPQSVDMESLHAKTIRGRAPINLSDAQTDAALAETSRALARRRGFRSQVGVPLLRHEQAIGAISVSRREPGGFADDEIALLRTFADQAVIAIENARLLSELQEKNESLTQAHAQVTEALEQQTATSAILTVIASSPTDVQPVLGAVAENAARLCHTEDASILQADRGVFRVMAYRGAARLKDFEGTPVSRGSVAGRAILDGQVVHVHNITRESDAEFSVSKALMEHFGHSTMLATPLLRQGTAIGAIFVRRTQVDPFSDKQIALLQTFADQAVIAIENVRLFTELQTSNRELTTALDTQTATADILRVISASRTDVQPVFDAIVESAVRLLRGAHSGYLTRVARDQIEIAAMKATTGAEAFSATYPRPLDAAGVPGHSIRARAPVNVADTDTDPRMTEPGRIVARAVGYRSVVSVPLLRRDEAIGAIGVSRREPGGFTDDEIALLQTFADQAVIAIENARLLTELQARTQELTHSVEQLTALGEVGRAVSSTLDLETVLTTIVSRAVALSGLDGGVVFEYDETEEVFIHRAATETGGSLAEARRATRVRKGEGVVGRTAITQEPAQVPDITVPGAYESRLHENIIRSGIRALLAVPMLREGRLIGAVVVSRNRPGEFPSETIDLLRTFATQSALAIQNARLFREIEIKSRELEVASQHKSEFLASMSHELRTPLNAIIGFSDVLLQGMFGEMTEKQTEYLQDILASGQHLLSLINDILDLSKIEAGRMELDLADFHLPSAIDDALLLMRERAGRRGITLDCHVDERLGEVRADQRKVKQVLLNLLSNAVKFTPEGGRIDVGAKLANGTVELSVTDTGIGIAPEDHDAVFEEFRQVGEAEKKAEGTGLGLALCRKFVELHGGRIWVKSQIGQGSTFTFTLPLSQ